MTTLFKRISTCLIAMLTLPFTMSTAFGGGLVETDLDAFNEATFNANSADITNPWWTLPAGSNLLYYAETEDGCAWNLIEVLALTTSAFLGDYAGTNARVVLDREWNDEDCAYDEFADVWANLDPEETTYDWYAQDTDQNIWYMGEDTLDSEGSSDGSFVAGCDGAEAGIVILGEPANGLFYMQEHYEDEAEDWGKVLNFVTIDGLTCMKTKEWTPLEPGNVEHKFYCSDGDTGELSLIVGLHGPNHRHRLHRPVPFRAADRPRRNLVRSSFCLPSSSSRAAGRRTSTPGSNRLKPTRIAA